MLRFGTFLSVLVVNNRHINVKCGCQRRVCSVLEDLPLKIKTSFLPGIFFREEAKSIIMQISFVMLIFLLFSDQISLGRMWKKARKCAYSHFPRTFCTCLGGGAKHTRPLFLKTGPFFLLFFPLSL